ncbi:LLM class flavin-dependent oxidoreductase [Streptosporangium sp. NPDC051022]|uniref:LLM class flavin-dependent oxidoreductase n=1 Tax=Streptosporangium sp. NPDC051022 TaxID=3155752 RepID=UPI00341C44BA
MNERSPVRLSILDTAPVWDGSSPQQALHDTVELAVHAERLGYHRYWVAEHHNAPFIASCAPAVLAGQIAGRTTTIRVGSGGVMLPNHAPLVVAEQFGTLEALNPGRIDLGIGRSPGSDMVTAHALRRVSGPPGSDFFSKQVAEVMGYFDLADGKTGGRIVAVPAQGNRPEIWLLGSSAKNARLAGRLGVRYAFAYHIKPGQAEEALSAYRAAFQPSEHLDRPYTIITASVVAAETDEHAEWLSGPLEVVMLEASAGARNRPNIGTKEAEHHLRSLPAEARDHGHLATHIIGGPETVRKKVADLVAATGTDELMAFSLIEDVEDRKRSCAVLASAVG